jgi:hypothetical protein
LTGRPGTARVSVKMLRLLTFGGLGLEGGDETAVSLSAFQR